MIPKSYKTQGRSCSTCGYCFAIQYPPARNWKQGCYCSFGNEKISKGDHIPDTLGCCDEWVPEGDDD